jgi:DNA-binding NtrC family response regulator
MLATAAIVEPTRGNDKSDFNADAEAHAHQQPASLRKILIVEDDLPTLAAWCELIPYWGYSVRGTSEARQALEYLESYCPDLIILDMNLPDGDGIEVLDALERRRIVVPTIVASASSTSSHATGSGRRNAVQFLRKPVDLMHLRRLIEELAWLPKI